MQRPFSTALHADRIPPSGARVKVGGLAGDGELGGADDAAELERRLLATELWPRAVVVPGSTSIAATTCRLPALDAGSMAVMLPPEEP